ncbi:MAG: hypothetical protein M8866_04955 [marine benthic group bacterium]|nr:hypothetical protein [Candidatus Benthicola marisminoris]
MKMFVSGITALLLACVSAAPLSAQEATCDDIGFDEQAVAAYPMVREACLDIIEHEGVRYAHIQALVHREGPPSMLLRFKHRDGTWGPATLVTPQPGFQVILDGQPVDVNSVQRGRELSIYLPEGRWEVAMSDADELTIAEAAFAPIEFEVTAEELPDEVDMEAVAEAVDASIADAGDAAADMEQAAEEAYEDEAGDDSEWLWILGLAGAFIIVWFLLRRRKARREG